MLQIAPVKATHVRCRGHRHSFPSTIEHRQAELPAVDIQTRRRFICLTRGRKVRTLIQFKVPPKKKPKSTIMPFLVMTTGKSTLLQENTKVTRLQMSPIGW